MLVSLEIGDNIRVFNRQGLNARAQIVISYINTNMSRDMCFPTVYHFDKR